MKFKVQLNSNDLKEIVAKHFNVEQNAVDIGIDECDSIVCDVTADHPLRGRYDLDSGDGRRFSEPY